MSDRPERDQPQLVDWRRLGRRLGLSAAILLTLSAVAWLLTGMLTDGVDPRELPGFVGLAVGGMFVAELVLVGGSAIRGLFRAGDRGERLAGGDVGLLPPQVGRRRGDRRRRGGRS